MKGPNFKFSPVPNFAHRSLQISSFDKQLTNGLPFQNACLALRCCGTALQHLSCSSALRRVFCFLNLISLLIAIARESIVQLAGKRQQHASSGIPLSSLATVENYLDLASPPPHQNCTFFQVLQRKSRRPPFSFQPDHASRLWYPQSAVLRSLKCSQHLV